MERQEALQAIVLSAITAMQRRRTILMKLLLSNHVKLLNNYAIARRRKIRKHLLSLQRSVPTQMLSLYSPRFRSIHRKERSESIWRSLNQAGNEQLYLETFRMRRRSFRLLCQKLEPHLASNNPLSVTPPVPLDKQVAVCLYRLATSAEYNAVGEIFGIHKSTVHKYFHIVLKAMLQLRSEYIKCPNLEEALRASTEFEKRCRIPNIFGAIGSTHIPIIPHARKYEDFLNKRGWTSMIMQAVADTNSRFTNVSVHQTCHESFVFKQSMLFLNAKQMIPQYYTLVDSLTIPLMIAGDAEYPLLPWLIKPYTTDGISTEEAIFNYYLNAAHFAVENAFDRLKGRWRCTAKGIDVNPDIVTQVVVACAILHNFVEDQNDPYLDEWTREVKSDEKFPQPPEHVCDEVITYGSMQPQEVRQNLTTYLTKYIST